MSDETELVSIGKVRFTVASTEFIIDDRYEFLKSLGSHRMGICIQAKDKNNNQLVSISKLNNLFSDLYDTLTIIKTLKLLRFLTHDNILSYQSILFPSSLNYSHIYAIQPYMQTSLFSIIRSNQSLTEEHLQYLMYQILLGLQYIHSGNIVHNDIKPANILINSDCSIRITGFEEAKGINYEIGMEDYVRNRWYASPEVIANGKEINCQADIWGAGCILAEMIGRKPLFMGCNAMELVRYFVNVLGTPSEEDMMFLRDERARSYIVSLPHVPKVNWNSMFPQAGNECLDLLDKMLSFNPRNRLKAEECLKHSFFRSLYISSDIKSCASSFDWSFENISPSDAIYKSIIHEECLLYST